jgi:hypothetical protein
LQSFEKLVKTLTSNNGFFSKILKELILSVQSSRDSSMKLGVSLGELLETGMAFKRKSMSSACVRREARNDLPRSSAVGRVSMMT